MQSRYSWNWHKTETQNTPPVTRRGCKVPALWQKSISSDVCSKMLFLQGLLFCSCLLGGKSQVGGCTYLQHSDLLLGHQVVQTGAKHSNQEWQSLFQSVLPPGMRWPATQCRHRLEPALTLVALRCYPREMSLSATLINLGLAMVTWREPRKELTCVWPACSEVKIDAPFPRSGILNLPKAGHLQKSLCISF